MSLSLVFIVSNQKNESEKTIQCIKQEVVKANQPIQLLMYGLKEDLDALDTIDESLISVEKIQIESRADKEFIYKNAAKKVTGEFVTGMESGDLWSEGALNFVFKTMEQNKQSAIFMLNKIMANEKSGAFANDVPNKDVIKENLDNNYRCYPFYMGGTFFKAEFLKKYTFDMHVAVEVERKFFLDLCLAHKKLVFIKAMSYFSFAGREGDIAFYEGTYELDYYTRSFTDFWMPYFDQLEKKYGKVPEFIQYHALFSIRSRINANLNNRNKHIVEDEQVDECFENISNLLKRLDDNVIFNAKKLTECDSNNAIKWIYGILKYGKDYRFDKYYQDGAPVYVAGRSVLSTIASLRTNILFMEYRDSKVEIDGSVNSVLFSLAEEVYLTYNGKKVPIVYNERYSHTKVFGTSIFKAHSFHASLPIDDLGDGTMFCVAKVGGEQIRIRFMYESHFSRMSDRFKNSYWFFGKEKQYLVTREEEGMHFARSDEKGHKKQERTLEWEMFKSKKKRAWLFIAIRRAYFMAKPFMKRKPMWMYIDKIYKAGDSSEYLYRYASAQKENINHYYLVDKKATDYKRLKKDGYKPLVRGSIKHRLVFLLSDMMIISNSTVFAFNNFGMKNSSYIRDLVDFHVCCVQHGMSVQKIAVAQNRLRDNTRLYFCASEYEIKNLSRPIYDYVGYDALKLTGVPRYDGLVNDDKKQIMISPTWRMQAAAPVRTSEGEQRDYNPLFKESTYYKVFNSLINDPRLIDAAKKYGYKIKYVLHPIVSSQVDDFDKNEFVDIVPAVGDMSYEKMFCESSLMVTDFSGIQFDFAYMRKPLVYLHHKDIPQHYEEGTFFYDTMAFGEICHDNDELIDMLIEYMSTGCKMKDEYVRRADDFFYYDDHNNCERIYKEMIDYQNKYIL
ncbi:MAG: CDP-glycerol glycerophosphotransferase family protein [Eubacteriales bacterium]|nr:CDP-glycerol glycerophosphotransferase family protein [Eubacteriales bacterium]